MTLDELQQVQKEYDAVYYDVRHAADEFSCVRHVTLHVGKLLGKMSAYVEQKEHGATPPSVTVEKEVIPDLLFWALHLANRYGLRLEDVYQNRLAQNKKRIEAARQSEE